MSSTLPHARIDSIASEKHFIAHLAPVWRAIPRELRGIFHAPGAYHEDAARRGITGLVDMPEIVQPKRTPFVLTASYGDAKRARKAGYTRQAFMEHGAGQAYAGDRRAATNGSYAGGEDRPGTDLFLVPNGYSGDRWRAAYPESQVEIVGCPKLDDLPRKERGDSPVIAATFHWDCSLVPETLPALEDFGPALQILAQTKTIIGHAHPRFAAIMQRHYGRWGIEFVPDFEEVCRRADLLVFDNTSAGFEFAATGRPVVVMNARGYRKHVNHGLRFWDAATVGVQVDAPQQPNARQAAGVLGEAIDAALDGAGAVEREAALDIVYPQRSGATERAVSALVGWAA